MSAGSGKANSGKVKLELDKSSHASVNLSMLQRIDPDVEEILASSNYCAVYQHQADPAAEQWVRNQHVSHNAAAKPPPPLPRRLPVHF
jgi:hypothetical protein